MSTNIFLDSLMTLATHSHPGKPAPFFYGTVIVSQPARRRVFRRSPVSTLYSGSDENLAVVDGQCRTRGQRCVALTRAHASGYVLKTCAEKRIEVGTTSRSGARGECGLRGPHGVVKSIRPGLEPRLPALLTVVRRERHQRD